MNRLLRLPTLRRRSGQTAIRGLNSVREAN